MRPGTGNRNVALVVSHNDPTERGEATDCAFIFWLLRVSQWKDQSTVDTAARYLQYLSHLWGAVLIVLFIHKHIKTWDQRVSTLESCFAGLFVPALCRGQRRRTSLKTTAEFRPALRFFFFFFSDNGFQCIASLFFAHWNRILEAMIFICTKVSVLARENCRSIAKGFRSTGKGQQECVGATLSLLRTTIGVRKNCQLFIISNIITTFSYQIW